jgi:uncharacterized protein
MSELEALCLSCGLCCDGSFFDRVPLTAQEASDFGSTHLKQRCSQLQGTCCKAYERRPLACKRFECLLFQALKDKELPLSAAQEIVLEMKSKLAQQDESRAEFQRRYFGRFIT